ncbi:MAG TPA: hypothetical protein VGD08_05330 [Stellaceae bacterium]|jgi:hypothetical protein
MPDDLPQLIRAAFNNAMMTEQDAAAAFDRAVELLQRRRPLLDIEEARRVVAELLEWSPLEK